MVADSSRSTPDRPMIRHSRYGSSNSFRRMRAIGSLMLVTVLTVLFAGPFPAAGRDSDAAARGTLLRRRRELRLQLLRERAALLRTDPELVELNERIQRLYHRLDAELAERPSIRALQTEIRKVDEALGASGNPPQPNRQRQ